MKYMMLINSGATHANGGAAECSVEDWMAYDKAVRDAGIPVFEGVTPLRGPGSGRRKSRPRRSRRRWCTGRYKGYRPGPALAVDDRPA